jgi:HTH-type transcriptional regulator/antitoxin HipB
MDYPVKNPSQLGQVLQGFRHAKRITQQAAGSRIGLPQSAISLLESNPSRSSVEKLFKYLSALELDVFVRDRAAPPSAKTSSKKLEW